jgi:pimeloyl-ACP methyl ester carboxylesterase
LDALPLQLDAIDFSRGILIGYGDGASIATIYTGGNKDHRDHRIRGLVLIAPHFFVEGGWDLHDSIAYIRVPVLIVRGTMDRVCTMAQIAAAQDEAYCPVDAGLIEGAGRAPHLERPEETLSVISGFVSTLFRTFGEGRRSDTIRSEQPDHGPRA